MKSLKRRFRVFPTLVITLLLFTQGCSGNSASTDAGVSGNASSVDNTIDNSQSSEGNTQGNNDASAILNRLNNSGSSTWIEDPANDLTGSNSIAVYLESGGDQCAVWVFANESDARSALDTGKLTFPSLKIYVGADSQSNLGIIALSPYAGADCEYVIANVLGWGKN